MVTDIMTMDEVAGYLRINKKTTSRLVADSKLPGFKVGGTWRSRRVNSRDSINRGVSANKDKET